MSAGSVQRNGYVQPVISGRSQTSYHICAIHPIYSQCVENLQNQEEMVGATVKCIFANCKTDITTVGSTTYCDICNQFPQDMQKKALCERPFLKAETLSFHFEGLFFVSPCFSALCGIPHQPKCVVGFPKVLGKYTEIQRSYNCRHTGTLTNILL